MLVTRMTRDVAFRFFELAALAAVSAALTALLMGAL